MLYGIYNSPLSQQTIRDKLTAMGYTPIQVRYSMNHPYNKRPCIVLATKNNEEWAFVFYSKKDMIQIQLGTENRLTHKEMVAQALALLNNPDMEFFNNNLNLEPTENRNLYWVVPVDTSSGTYMYFDLLGNLLKERPSLTGNN